MNLLSSRISALSLWYCKLRVYRTDRFQVFSSKIRLKTWIICVLAFCLRHPDSNLLNGFLSNNRLCPARIWAALASFNIVLLPAFLGDFKLILYWVRIKLQLWLWTVLANEPKNFQGYGGIELILFKFLQHNPLVSKLVSWFGISWTINWFFSAPILVCSLSRLHQWFMLTFFCTQLFYLHL